MGKIYTMAEVAEHDNPNNFLLVIEGKVYDVTKFLEDHPGGDEVLLTATGKDATDEFEDVGHSLAAREIMEEMLVGEIDTATIPSKIDNSPLNQPQHDQDKTHSLIIKLLQFLAPLIILGLAMAVRSYAKNA